MSMTFERGSSGILLIEFIHRHIRAAPRGQRESFNDFHGLNRILHIRLRPDTAGHTPFKTLEGIKDRITDDFSQTRNPEPFLSAKPANNVTFLEITADFAAFSDELDTFVRGGHRVYQ